jgi:hypothetical protein
MAEGHGLSMTATAGEISHSALNAVSARSVGMTTSSIEQYDYLIRP